MYFEELIPYELKAMMQRLNNKLIMYPPTDLQTKYYEYSKRYRGFEFLNIKSGRVYSKYELWMKFNGDTQKINRVIRGNNKEFHTQLKVGWRINEFGEAARVRSPKKRVLP